MEHHNEPFDVGIKKANKAFRASSFQFVAANNSKSF
jgi:hypothetical protein